MKPASWECDRPEREVEWSGADVRFGRESGIHEGGEEQRPSEE